MAEVAGFDAKEQVRQATDIVDLVGSYLPLRREGRNYKALCPWHDDSKPSLQVNPQRQSFKCWVCNIGGDIFSFVMKMENVEFVDALNLLAEKAGIQIDRRGGPGGGTDDRQLLFKVLSWAEDQFHHYLVDSPEAEVARRYFDDRGLTDESIGKYRLGFSPDRWDWLAQKSTAAGFAEALLEKAGLVISREDKPGCYDRFRGRALFPIHDPQGRTIAFGGRVLPQFADKTPAKYINSPETPLFSKHRVLYGLNSARDALAKSKTALIMEGYTDCIMARQFGVANSVAVLGTALGESHLKLLRQHNVERVVLVLDGDEAGQKRTNEILELFVSEPIDLRVMTLPDNLDPCDLLIERGKATFDHLQANAVDALEHAFQVATSGLGSNSNPHDLSRAMEKVLGTLAKVPSASAGASTEQSLREATLLSRMSRMFSVREEALVERLRELRRTLGTKRAATTYAGEDDEQITPVEPLAPLHTWPLRELELLELILLEPECLLAVADELRPDELKNEAAQTLFRLALGLAREGRTPDFATLMNTLEDERYKNLLVDLDERAQTRSLSIEPAERLRLFLDSVRRERVVVQQQQRQRVLREDTQPEADKLQILQQMIEQERLKRGLTSSMDG
jgi:DNA primase